MAGQSPSTQGQSPQGQPLYGEETPGLLPGNHWETLPEGDAPEDDDGDSALGSDAASSTESVTSTAFHYRTVHDRTYHRERGNALYWGSNDDKQNEFLDIHYLAKSLLFDKKLHLAPIKKDIQKAVDIGTGTGIWAIDFADEFSNTEVIGTDISPIQPAWVPPNLSFEIEDCTSDWTFKPNSLDYVHMDWLVGSVVDWTDLFKQAYRSLKPGGYVESIEGGIRHTSDDETVSEDSAMGQWDKIFTEASRKFGRPFTVVRDGLQRKSMEEAGFVDIHEADFKAPIGGWPQDPRMAEIGRLQQWMFVQDVEGLVTFAADQLGWTKEQITVYCACYRKEARDPKKHGYYRVKAVWAKKPE